MTLSLLHQIESCRTCDLVSLLHRCDDADTLRQKYQACRELGVLGVGVYALDFVSYTGDQGAANWAALSAVWPRPPIQPTTASALKSNDDGDAAADVKLSFGAPVVVGSSNRSHFYFPVRTTRNS